MKILAAGLAAILDLATSCHVASHRSMARMANSWHYPLENNYGFQMPLTQFKCRDPDETVDSADYNKAVGYTNSTLCDHDRYDSVDGFLNGCLEGVLPHMAWSLGVMHALKRRIFLRS